MTITAQHVERVLRSIPGAYGRQIASLDVLAAGATAALRTAPPGLTVQGAAAFLATMSQESASLRATEEYAKHGRYAPYIGRTFEMVTWEANYRAFGYWCAARGLVDGGETFVDHPKSLADVRWAWLGGVWFWQVHGIWAYANRGAFLATQRAVNLGSPTSSATPVGMAARNAWYAAWLKVGADLIPDPVAPDPVTPAPNPDPSPSPDTGRPIDMAAAQDVYINYEGKQALVEGDNEIAISATSKTLVIGPNDGVDVLATIDVTDAAGTPVPVESFFRVVSYKDKTPTTTISSRRPTSSDQVSFKGDISKDVDGRSPRLRLIIRVPAGVTGAVLNTVQISGWKL